MRIINCRNCVKNLVKIIIQMKNNNALKYIQKYFYKNVVSIRVVSEI